MMLSCHSNRGGWLCVTVQQTTTVTGTKLLYLPSELKLIEYPGTTSSFLRFSYNEASFILKNLDDFILGSFFFFFFFSVLYVYCVYIRPLFIYFHTLFIYFHTFVFIVYFVPRFQAKS